MILLSALLVLVVVVLSSSATAWTTESLSPAWGGYKTGYAYRTGMDYYMDESINSGSLLQEYVSIPLSNTSRGWVSFRVNHLDDRTYIKGASLRFRAWSPSTADIQVKVMSMEMHTLDARSAYFAVGKATTVDTVTVTGGFYAVNITGRALDTFRTALAGDSVYVVIGFQVSGNGTAGIVINEFNAIQTDLWLVYDAQAPDVPSADPLPPFVAGDHVTVTWSPSADNPIDGNRSGVTYQVGVYLPGAPAGNPYYTSPWVDANSWDLTGIVDSVEYTFRVRARDGSAFESEWSAPVNTTVDNSPPSVPVLHHEPDFTEGTGGFNHVRWSGSTDAGIGNITYILQVSRNHHFDPPLTDEYTTQGTWYNVTGLLGNAGYVFRVRAVDGLGHTSEWSDQVSTYMDSDPPTVPLLWEQPEYILGDALTVGWSPSRDLLSGVFTYNLEVATTPDFSDGPHIDHDGLFPFSTSVLVGDLEDGMTYYFRVRCQDRLFHYSKWSPPVNSTPDNSPPTVPVLDDVPYFTNGTSITLTWNRSTDEGSGVSHYQVHCFPEGTPEAVRIFETTATWATFPYLVDGEAYHCTVIAYDAMGNHADDRWLYTTIDNSPPTVPVFDPLSRYSTTDTVHVSWKESLDKLEGMDYGIGSVQYRLFWDLVRTDWSLDEDLMGDSGWIDTTSYDVEGLRGGREWWFEVQARDGLGHVSAFSDPVTTKIANEPPAVSILEPFDMATLSRVVNVMGYCLKDTEDAYFLIELGVAGESGWLPMTPVLTETEPYGFVFQWDTTQFPDGVYTLRVTAEDELGMNGSASSNFTLANARLSLSAPDITVSDTSPEVGDTVTVTVTVHNLGDPTAKDVSLDIYDDGVITEVDLGQGSMDVPSWSAVTWSFEFTVTGTHVFTARAHSDMYDTGEMPVGVTVRGVKEESEPSAIEDSATWIGVIAIVLSVIAIALNLVDRRTSESEASGTGEGNLLVESEDEGQ